MFGVALGTWGGAETLGGLAASSALWGLGLVLLAEIAKRTGAGVWIGLVAGMLAIGRTQELRVFGATPGGWTAGVALVLILGWAWYVKALTFRKLD